MIIVASAAGLTTHLRHASAIVCRGCAWWQRLAVIVRGCRRRMEGAKGRWCRQFYFQVDPSFLQLWPSPVLALPWHATTELRLNATSPAQKKGAGSPLKTIGPMASDCGHPIPVKE
jgi:hypothetical protein